MKYSFEEVLGQSKDILKSDYQTKEFYDGLNEKVKKDGFWRGIIWSKTKEGENIQTALSVFRTDLESGDYNYIYLYNNWVP
jgi:NNP family nitrate/nitrite transporter-like MFS transporter